MNTSQPHTHPTFTIYLSFSLFFSSVSLASLFPLKHVQSSGQEGLLSTLRQQSWTVTIYYNYQEAKDDRAFSLSERGAEGSHGWREWRLVLHTKYHSSSLASNTLLFLAKGPWWKKQLFFYILTQSGRPVLEEDRIEMMRGVWWLLLCLATHVFLLACPL